MSGECIIISELVKSRYFDGPDLKYTKTYKEQTDPFYHPTVIKLRKKWNMPRKPKEKIYSYDEIRDELRTFDILNCVYGTQWWNPAHWIMGLIGHTAMVYICKETGQIFVYESTQMSSKGGLSGVQLRPMREWLEQYPGKVYLRHVAFDMFDEAVRRLCLIAKLEFTAHIKKYRGTKYPDLKKWRWRWFLANAAIDLPWKSKLQNPDINFVMFCTQLVGDVFRFCKLFVAACLNPAELKPGDLREGNDSIFTASLVRGITIGKRKRLK